MVYPWAQYWPQTCSTYTYTTLHGQQQHVSFLYNRLSHITLNVYIKLYIYKYIYKYFEGNLRFQAECHYHGNLKLATQGKSFKFPHARKKFINTKRIHKLLCKGYCTVYIVQPLSEQVKSSLSVRQVHLVDGQHGRLVDKLLFVQLQLLWACVETGQS